MRLLSISNTFVRLRMLTYSLIYDYAWMACVTFNRIHVNETIRVATLLRIHFRWYLTYEINKTPSDMCVCEP